MSLLLRKALATILFNDSIADFIRKCNENNVSESIGSLDITAHILMTSKKRRHDKIQNI